MHVYRLNAAAMGQIALDNKKTDMNKPVSTCHHGATILFRKSNIKHTNEGVLGALEEKHCVPGRPNHEVREGPHSEAHVSPET